MFFLDQEIKESRDGREGLNHQNLTSHSGIGIIKTH